MMWSVEILPTGLDTACQPWLTSGMTDTEQEQKDGSAVMSVERYNGWTNYETWRVNLELVSHYADMLVADGETVADDDYDLVEFFKNYVEEMLFGNDVDETHPIVAGYARSFLSNVNWYEIASYYAELVRSDEDSDDNDNDTEVLQ